MQNILLGEPMRTLNPKEKMQMTKAFIEKMAKGRGIIFANQKNQVDENGDI